MGLELLTTLGGSIAGYVMKLMAIRSQQQNDLLWQRSSVMRWLRPLATLLPIGLASMLVSLYGVLSSCRSSSEWSSCQCWPPCGECQSW